MAGGPKRLRAAFVLAFSLGVVAMASASGSSPPKLVEADAGASAGAPEAEVESTEDAPVDAGDMDTGSHGDIGASGGSEKDTSASAPGAPEPSAPGSSEATPATTAGAPNQALVCESTVGSGGCDVDPADAAASTGERPFTDVSVLLRLAPGGLRYDLGGNPSPGAGISAALSEEPGLPGGAGVPGKAPLPSWYAETGLIGASQAATAISVVPASGAAVSTGSAVSQDPALPQDRGPVPEVLLAATVAALALIVALYHRFRNHELALSPERAAILDAIRGSPGITASDLAARREVSLNAVLYHIRLLARGGLVRVRRVGPARLVFPVEMRVEECEDRAAVRAPLARALLVAALARPVVAMADAAREMGVARSSARKQLRKLEARGLCELTRDQARLTFRLTSSGTELARGMNTAADGAAARDARAPPAPETAGTVPRSHGTLSQLIVLGLGMLVLMAPAVGNVGTGLDPGTVEPQAPEEAAAEMQKAAEETKPWAEEEAGDTQEDPTGVVEPQEGTPAPDLLVTDIEWSPEAPREGHQLRFSAKVKNAGGSRADNFTVSFVLDNSTLLGNLTVGKLDAGKMRNVKWAFWNATEGNHTIKVVADPDGNATEADETNNARSEDVAVPAADEHAPPGQSEPPGEDGPEEDEQPMPYEHEVDTPEEIEKCPETPHYNSTVRTQDVLGDVELDTLNLFVVKVKNVRAEARVDSSSIKLCA